jgi:hypothetical protein
MRVLGEKVATTLFLFISIVFLQAGEELTTTL